MAIYSPIKKIFNWQLANEKIQQPPYKVYTALLYQGGTNPPTAVVLENTIGLNPTFIYNTVGDYTISFPKDNSLPSGKTVVFIGNADLLGADTVGWTETSFSNSSPYINNAISIGCLTLTGSSDQQLYNTSFEIRVYN